MADVAGPSVINTGIVRTVMVLDDDDQVEIQQAVKHSNKPRLRWPAIEKAVDDQVRQFYTLKIRERDLDNQEDIYNRLWEIELAAQKLDLLAEIVQTS